MGAAFGLMCLLALDGVGAAACPPVAMVQGPTKIVASIRQLLRAHGVTAERGACPDQGVRASLLAQAGSSTSYHLHIEDAFGRMSDRQVSDAETAASLIESWAVPAAEDVPVPPPAEAAPAVTRRTAEDVRQAAKVDADTARWRLGGSLELAAGSDDSLWYGGALTACGTLAALCVGGRLRIARDDSLVGPDRDVTRSATELLLLVSLPLARRGVTLTPMLGLGVGWIHTGNPRPEPDVDSLPSDDLGMRVEAATSAGLALSRHVSLVGEVGLSWGLSMAATERRNGASPVLHVPTGYLRTAVACQYAP